MATKLPPLKSNTIRDHDIKIHKYYGNDESAVHYLELTTNGYIRLTKNDIYELYKLVKKEF